MATICYCTMCTRRLVLLIKYSVLTVQQLGNCHFQQKDFARAALHFTQQFKMAKRVRDPVLISVAYRNLGNAFKVRTLS